MSEGPVTGDENGPAWIEGEAVIEDAVGLHARPAVKLTKLAKTFVSTVELRADGSDRWISAKSPNAVMKLRAAHASRLKIRASGEDAVLAVERIVALVRRNFDD